MVSFDPSKKVYSTSLDLKFHNYIRNNHLGKGRMTPHQYENTFGAKKEFWIHNHFKHEQNLFDILSNLENFGIGRKVQFRQDIDPYCPINNVNRETTKHSQQAKEVCMEYDENERTKESDSIFYSNKQLNDRVNSTFWTISRVFPDWTAPGMDYGFAYGYLTINGVEMDDERSICHCNKPGWVLVPKIYEHQLNSQKRIQPEVFIKPMYSKLPPMVMAKTLGDKVNDLKNSQDNSNIREIPMMRNVTRRGSLDDLSSI